MMGLKRIRFGLTSLLFAGVGVLISGYSGKLDSAILVCLYHEVVRGLGVNVWLSFVYSEDNWSDEPSRGDYRSLLAAGGSCRVTPQALRKANVGRAV